MYYTTNCTIGYDSFENLESVIKYCYNNNQQCDDGSYSCDIVNSTLKKIIDESLSVSENSPNKAYNLSIDYMTVNSSLRSENMFNLQNGIFLNCSSEPGAVYSINQNNLGEE